MNQVTLSIVIPAYNEQKRLPQTIQDIRSFFAKFQVGLEVLIVIEKSTDKTLELANKAAHGSNFIQVIDNKIQKGKGYAVKSGMLKARGDIVIFMDADLSTPLAEVVRFLAYFSENPQTDIVIGSRADKKSQILRKQSWLRRNMGRCFNAFVQIFAIKGITDTQCGFKAFRLHTIHEIFSRQTFDGFSFDVEILLLAQKLGYKIDILPVQWVNSPDSKVRILIDPLKMFLDLLKVRLRVRQTLQELPPSLKSS